MWFTVPITVPIIVSEKYKFGCDTCNYIAIYKKYTCGHKYCEYCTKKLYIFEHCYICKKKIIPVS